VKEEVPTLENVLSTLKEEIKFPGGKEFLIRVLKRLVLNLKSAKNKRSFMGRDDTVAWKATYLRMKNHELGSNKKRVFG
jgi:hypothetical protein